MSARGSFSVVERELTVKWSRAEESLCVHSLHVMSHGGRGEGLLLT